MTVLSKQMQGGREMRLESEDGINVTVVLDGRVMGSGPICKQPVKGMGYQWVAADKALLTEEDCQAAEAAMQTLRQRAEEERMARLEAAIPGLSVLRAARDAYGCAEDNHRAASRRMMDDEHNDGARPTAAVPQDIKAAYEEALALYPRAALYLRAEDYTCASNDRKYSAGKSAMALLEQGGSEADARALLDNWLPQTAAWD